MVSIKRVSSCVRYYAVTNRIIVAILAEDAVCPSVYDLHVVDHYVTQSMTAGSPHADCLFVLGRRIASTVSTVHVDFEVVNLEVG